MHQSTALTPILIPACPTDFALTLGRIPWIEKKAFGLRTCLVATCLITWGQNKLVHSHFGAISSLSRSRIWRTANVYRLSAFLFVKSKSDSEALDQVWGRSRCHNPTRRQ